MCGDSGVSISSYNNNFIFNKDKNEIKIGDNTFEINNNTFNMFIKEDNKFYLVLILIEIILIF
jgi:hypothetical protein